MVSVDSYMYRSWQLSFDRWSSWDKTGYSAPKSVHAPIVHPMGYNFFNGKLNVFVHGIDEKLHHISQTTCDKVPNPWGWCTWGLWSTISGDIPSNSNYPPNSLSIGNNLHLGLEVCKCGQLHRKVDMLFDSFLLIVTKEILWLLIVGVDVVSQLYIFPFPVLIEDNNVIVLQIVNID